MKRIVTWGGAFLAAATLASPAGAPLLAQPAPAPERIAAAPVRPAERSCAPGVAERMVTNSRSWVALASGPLVARARPGGRVIARFERLNVNAYRTLFAVRSRMRDSSCRVAWYEVQLPVKPNGRIGWVSARAVRLAQVDTRIVVDLSRRSLRFFEDGRLRLRVTVGIGRRTTPTPVGRFYVNQRLVPTEEGGPFGPAALGVSAFSEVLTNWPQGGPIAIHGTNEPASVGLAASNGCIRVENETLRWLFEATPAGTPVTIHP